jgi:hypothetical protein
LEVTFGAREPLSFVSSAHSIVFATFPPDELRW